MPDGGAEVRRAPTVQDRAARLQLPRPRRIAQAVLLALAIGICDQNYWQYSNVDHYWPKSWLPYIYGTGLAPEQYRIGVKFVAWWLVEHLHWGFRYGFTLLDTIGLFVAVLLTYRLLEQRKTVREASIELQWLAAAVLFALAAYYLLWVGFFFRPETLPSTGFTVVLAWLWTARSKGSSRDHIITVGGLILASAAQAWIRPDIPVALNAGIFFIGISRYGRDLPLPKRIAIATSLVCIAVAVGIQLYIMRVMFPHAGYGPIPILMVTHDLHQWLTFPPFLVFMFPVAWTGLQAWRQRANLDGPSLGVLLGAAIYLFLWILLGKIDEVRIFLPFALALSPLTAELVLRNVRRPQPDLAAPKLEGEV